jgi:hypothetical protein
MMNVSPSLFSLRTNERQNLLSFFTVAENSGYPLITSIIVNIIVISTWEFKNSLRSSSQHAILKSFWDKCLRPPRFTHENTEGVMTFFTPLKAGA